MKRIVDMNTKSFICLMLLFIMGALFVGCDDVIEEDITDENIVITAPLNGVTVVSNSVTFQWNSNSGSDDYRVQVNDVSNTIVVDSLVSTNSFTYPLSPGVYSWRVRGENFAYQTAYTFPVSFTLEASTIMTNQTVILNSPSDNFPTNSTTGQFVTWADISTADSYTLELDRDVSGNVSTINQFPGITDASYTIGNADMSTDGIYIWKVKALNIITATETLYSTRKILLDTQVPNVPVFVAPLADAAENQNSPITFSWDNGTDPGVVNTTVNSVLELASDINFTNVVQTYTVASNSESHTFTATGDYFWRIKNKDTAGNESSYTAPRKVIIN